MLVALLTKLKGFPSDTWQTGENLEMDFLRRLTVYMNWLKL